MAKTHKVSGSGQIFCLLALSQCFWLLCYRPRMTNALLTAAAAAIVSGAVFLPAVFCRRRAAKCLPAGPVSGAAGAILGSCYFSVTAMQLLAAVRVIFEELFRPVWLLLILFVVVMASAAMGQEALGRAAFIVTALFLAGVVLLAAGAAGQCSLLNLELPERHRGMLAGEILYLLPMQAELLLLMGFAPLTDRPSSAKLLLWIPSGWLINAVILLLVALVLGPYGGLQSYPVYALSRAAGLSALSGLMPVYCFLLLTSAFFRLSALAVMSMRLAQDVIGRPQPAFWAVAALCLAGVFLLYFTGWEPAGVYSVLAAPSLAWLLWRILRGGKKRA